MEANILYWVTFLLPRYWTWLNHETDWNNTGAEKLLFCRRPSKPGFLSWDSSSRRIVSSFLPALGDTPSHSLETYIIHRIFAVQHAATLLQLGGLVQCFATCAWPSLGSCLLLTIRREFVRATMLSWNWIKHNQTYFKHKCQTHVNQKACTHTQPYTHAHTAYDFKLRLCWVGLVQTLRCPKSPGSSCQRKKWMS